MSWESIPGWFAFRQAYDEMVEIAHDGDVIVEVGVAFGRSLAYLARKVIDSRKKIRVIGVDPWIDDASTEKPTWGAEHAVWARQQGGPFNAFCESMRAHAREELERIEVWRMKSIDAARVLAREPSIAGVLIDANHYYEHVRQDILTWRPLVRVGGILAGDDYSTVDFPGVVRAVDEIFPDRLQRGTHWLVRL